MEPKPPISNDGTLSWELGEDPAFTTEDLRAAMERGDEPSASAWSVATGSGIVCRNPD